MPMAESASRLTTAVAGALGDNKLDALPYDALQLVMRQVALVPRGLHDNIGARLRGALLTCKWFATTVLVVHSHCAATIIQRYWRKEFAFGQLCVNVALWWRSQPYLHHAHTVLPAQHPLVTQEWWEYSSFDDNVNDERLDLSSTASRVAWQQLVQDSADGTWLGNDSALWWAMLRHLQAMWENASMEGYGADPDAFEYDLSSVLPQLPDVGVDWLPEPLWELANQAYGKHADHLEHPVGRPSLRRAARILMRFGLQRLRGFNVRLPGI